ncbi:hypothetical protein ACFQHV_04585 [Promicromonospora thailandica]|uniref:Spheroidene monooxygenase n=1 Tax=Promicromonospora thailandica TaxID=765201 RepID=A0A9X2JWQ6_9MICO|nr:hypothetical protein [Promicromonospora thailandica]MCP2265802.1 hypothetical protein [Promicromonospora thailandica]BFF21829.1 hypothetical protein GCM10025730_53500 [Promicromonospora thailandica]
MIHTFHLAELPAGVTARALVRPPSATTVPGLDHAECLALMRLGAPTVSLDRLQLRRIAVFAQWHHEDAVDRFLSDDTLGRHLATGWHVRLEYLRRWSRLAALPGLPARTGSWDQDEPVVAVTVARMRLPEVPRFLRWGKPVERQVRDHPGTTLALAAFRPPHTIATFSVWRTVREMESVVHGRAAGPVSPDRRHADAMAERRRRDFHHEFATFRFRPLAEHGAWEGRAGIVPVG